MLLLAITLALSAYDDRVPIDVENEEYPADWRGTWAPSLADCGGDSGQNQITIGKTKIWTYEADSKLLKLTPIMYFSGPKGIEAKSIHALVAERGEMEIGTGKLRLTLAGGKLYTSRLNAVAEDDQWKYGNVRCR